METRSSVWKILSTGFPEFLYGDVKQALGNALVKIRQSVNMGREIRKPHREV